MSIRTLLLITALIGAPFACGLEAQAVAMEKNITVATLAKPIEAADLATFEKLFNAHEITTEEKKSLTKLARVARTKLQTECETMGTHTGNAPTFLTGLAQGVVGLWALFNTIITGPIAVNFRDNDIYLPPLYITPLVPYIRLPFCFIQWKSSDLPYKKLFEPKLDQQLPRLWAGCALTALPLAALTAYAFYKAGVNISRGLNYKKYLGTKIANLDAIIEYLA